jgi:hypothetical protein
LDLKPHFCWISSHTSVGHMSAFIPLIKIKNKLDNIKYHG